MTRVRSDQARAAQPCKPSPRKVHAEALCHAIGQCHPSDALAICSAFLEEHATGGPGLAPLLDMTVADARWWADVAPPHEVVAYGMAALDRLNGSPLGLSTRKKLFVALWGSLPEDDKLRFAQRICPEGQITRRNHV